MNMDSNEINILSIRAKQSIGAILLYEAALIEKVLTPDLGKLILHLFSVLSEKNLPHWERNGAVLSINGRGDALDEISRLIFGSNEFILDLIDFSTEIGLSCMYKSDFDTANIFLKKCIEVIKNTPRAKSILKIDISDFDSMQALDWGATISAEHLSKLKQKHMPLIEKV